jgi:dephospho-CoA kinase
LTSEDEYDALGKTVAAKMRKIKEYQCIFADKLINDVLFKAAYAVHTDFEQLP